MRSARPKALNTVSIWWWVLVPRRLSMCRVTQRVVDEALEELLEQVDVEAADQLARVYGTCISQAWAAGEVDDHARQRFVQRHVGVTVATDALLVADGLGECLAQGDTDVFHGVVVIDVQVALALTISRSISP